VRILEEARSQVARTVTTAMVHAYWQLVRESVEVELTGLKTRRRDATH
jgi:hypothetical protein